MDDRAPDRRRKNLESATRSFADTEKIRSVSCPGNRIHPACLGTVLQSAVFIARPGLARLLRGVGNAPGPRARPRLSRGSRCHGRRGLPTTCGTGPADDTRGAPTGGPRSGRNLNRGLRPRHRSETATLRGPEARRAGHGSWSSADSCMSGRPPPRWSAGAQPKLGRSACWNRIRA